MSSYVFNKLQKKEVLLEFLESTEQEGQAILAVDTKVTEQDRTAAGNYCSSSMRWCELCTSILSLLFKGDSKC